MPFQFAYMNKIAVGKAAKDVIDINAPVETNLRNTARAMGRSVEELTVVVLDRPRHDQLLAEIRSTGARVKLISDGDVAAGIHAALPDSGVDVLMGIGGTTEGVLTAAAIRCIDGIIQCKAWPRNDAERQAALDAGVDLEQVHTTTDLVGGEDVFFAATGASTGDLLRGVHFFPNGVETHTLVMRSRSGTLRWIDSLHDFTRLSKVLYEE